MTRFVLLLIVAVCFVACSSDEEDSADTQASPTDVAGPETATSDTVAADTASADTPTPPKSTGFVLSSFGFVYPEGGVSAAAVDGFDLDGVTSTSASRADGGCAHDDFPGGVDYQFLRLIDTFGGLQKGQIVDGVIHGAVRNGSMTMLIDLEGYDGPDDSSVKVRVLSSEDAPLTGAGGGVLPGSTFTEHSESRFISNVVEASASNGVIEAGPFDIRWVFNIQIVQAELHIHGARVRIEVAADGSAKGIIGGLWDLADVREIIVDPTTSNGNAAGFTKEEGDAALDKHADAAPDGLACTAISTVFEFEAVSAFITAP